MLYDMSGMSYDVAAAVVELLHATEDDSQQR